MNSVMGVVVAIVPSIGIGFLFYKVIKAILEGDRNERLAHARWEAAHSSQATFEGAGQGDVRDAAAQGPAAGNESVQRPV